MKNLLKFFFFILIIIADISAQNYKCNICNKEINGSYLEINNKYFHPECIKCAYCGKQVEGAFNTENEKFYHPECFAEKNGLKCHICLKAITGEYIVQDGKKYHKECYDKYAALKCSICNQTITGSYKTDYYGNVFHTEHETHYSKCSNCGRMIAQGIVRDSYKLPDGRIMCGFCSKDASKTPSYSEILKRVMKILEKEGFKLDLENVKIFAVDKNKLKSEAKDSWNENLKGFCHTIKTTEKGFFSKSVKISHKIYILNSLPEIDASQILAHELMHAWIQQNAGKIEHDRKFEEGSCNYLAYLYLKSIRGKESEIRIKKLNDDPDPIYGEGFRLVYEKMRGKGLDHLLALLRNYRKI